MWQEILTAEYWVEQWQQVFTRVAEAGVGILWALLLLWLGRWLAAKSIDALVRSLAARSDHRHQPVYPAVHPASIHAKRDTSQ